ncbi:MULTISPECIES: ankyrin repeat domain-containing protein [unclassified Mycobacteroides]|uniref:ankyrin repeat domain-containing protein n=1 Tax=unclassified Mycobacteroides TaxID=2618759 RepID=UPI0012DEA906|nr:MULTISPECIES: ankyrin repeat domain-containing protein [unclassified Mycobacteroides]
MEPDRDEGGDAGDPSAGEAEHRARVAEQVAGLADELFAMAREGNASTLAAYLDAGASVDLTNEAGDTLVMLAAYHGNASTVRSLVSRGADVNRANGKGQTPLAGAVFKGADDIVDLLLKAGADPAAGTPSAVDAARMFGKDEYLSLFGA